MKIFYFPKFLRHYKSLAFDVKSRAVIAEDLFRKNPFDRKLKTHKLSGTFKGYWAFSIDIRYRVIFELYKKDIILFHDVGSHNIYR